MTDTALHPSAFVAHDDHAHVDRAPVVAEPDLDLADQVFRLVRTWSYLPFVLKLVS